MIHTFKLNEEVKSSKNESPIPSISVNFSSTSETDKFINEEQSSSSVQDSKYANDSFKSRPILRRAIPTRKNGIKGHSVSDKTRLTFSFIKDITEKSTERRASTKSVSLKKLSSQDKCRTKSLPSYLFKYRVPCTVHNRYLQESDQATYDLSSEDIQEGIRESTSPTKTVTLLHSSKNTDEEYLSDLFGSIFGGALKRLYSLFIYYFTDQSSQRLGKPSRYNYTELTCSQLTPRNVGKKDNDVRRNSFACSLFKPFPFHQTKLTSESTTDDREAVVSISPQKYFLSSGRQHLEAKRETPNALDASDSGAKGNAMTENISLSLSSVNVCYTSSTVNSAKWLTNSPSMISVTDSFEINKREIIYKLIPSEKSISTETIRRFMHDSSEKGSASTNGSVKSNQT